MNTKKKAKQVCEKCGSKELKNRSTTYPMQLGERQINIGRVAVKECLECHFLMPTTAGKEKIGRCILSVYHMLSSNGISPT